MAINNGATEETGGVFSQLKSEKSGTAFFSTESARRYSTISPALQKKAINPVYI